MHSLIQSASDEAAYAALGGEATTNAATAVVQHQVRRVTCGEGAAREQLCRTKSSRHTKRVRTERNEKGRLIMMYYLSFMRELKMLAMSFIDVRRCPVSTFW
jgi:hypothetical protein